jgi:hypothetical protein
MSPQPRPYPCHLKMVLIFPQVFFLALTSVLLMLHVIIHTLRTGMLQFTALLVPYFLILIGLIYVECAPISVINDHVNGNSVVFLSAPSTGEYHSCRLNLCWIDIFSGGFNIYFKNPSYGCIDTISAWSFVILN